MKRAKSVTWFVVVILLLAIGFSKRFGLFKESYNGKTVRKNEVEVVKVIDGDTAVMLLDGKKEKIRFEGIDTPETVKRNCPVEFFGPEASEFTKKSLSGRKVTLEIQIKNKQLNRDKYGRVLAVVWLGDENFNLSLIKGGFAQATEFKPFQYYNQFHDWENRIKNEGKGLWRKAK